MWFFEIFNILALVILYILLLNHSLNIFQQYHYDVKKYIISLPKFYVNNKLMWVIYIVTIFSLLTSPYLTIVNLILCLIVIIKPPKHIVKLKITKRIIRLVITYFVFLMFLMLITFNHYTLFIFFAKVNV